MSLLPREKLKMYGIEALTDQELLTIILNSGNKNSSVFQISEQLLSHYHSFKNMLETNFFELTNQAGIGESKAASLLAVIEIAKRIYTIDKHRKYRCQSPKQAAQYLMNHIRFCSQEKLIAIHLNTKNYIISDKVIFQGSLDSSLIHPREIFKEALRCSAQSIIIAHNHPSGDPTPSQEDINVTQRLINCGQIMGIHVLDHIIIGDGCFTSLIEDGYLTRENNRRQTV